MTNEFKVTIGVKEQTIKADTEGQATDLALQQLTSNVAWVSATKVEPRNTGFRPPEKSNE